MKSTYIIAALALFLTACGQRGEQITENVTRVTMGDCVVYKSLVEGTHVWASPNCHVAGR